MPSATRKNSKADPLATLGASHNLDAERAVLGSVLLDNRLLASARDFGLTPRSFFDPRHQVIFGAMADAAGEGLAFDPSFLAARLDGRSQSAGGVDYMAGLEGSVLSTSLFGNHAEIVASHARRRELAEITSQGLRLVADGAQDGEGFRDALDGHLEKVARRNGRPATTTARALRDADFVAPREIIRGVRFEGLTILAARPKKGKSWLELANSIAVAEGSPALGGFPTDAGNVLYLALEDSPRRMHGRLKTILGDAPWPERLTFAHDWKRLDRGGLDDLRRWLDETRDPAMIVVDTLARVKPPRPKAADPYSHDAEVTAALQRLALENNVSIVAITHQRKAASDDVFDSITGTLGTTASADCIAVLSRTKDTGRLDITGRDIGERALVLEFADGLWRFVGDAEEVLDDGDPLEPARAFLLDVLDAGAIESENLFDMGRAAGISRNKLFTVKREGFVKARKQGFDGKWAWELVKGMGQNGTLG